ncbi:hypothetical protein GmRootA79_22500 [Acidovorax sp. A79]|uniref:hypothetical protein n=1 Tax=Acidovorax sp. A79 TaxID=3056107 RepID=UPI0034E8EFCF
MTLSPPIPFRSGTRLLRGPISPVRPPWRRGAGLGVLLLCTALLAACGTVPVSSLWKLRKLQLETLDPAALRAAVVHGPGLRLHGPALELTVSVSRKVRQPGGGTTTERWEEKLPLQELSGTAERSPLAPYDTARTAVQVWRIDPEALPRLQALRAKALAWKTVDDGPRELGLGVELAGCQKGSAGNRLVTTLMRFTDPGEYIPLAHNMDLAETMPAAELARRFPDCAAG